MQHGVTTTRLTVEQLEEAAADLRNAALVVSHAGHAKHSLVDFITGGVCAAGAVEVATFKKLVSDFTDVTSTCYIAVDVGPWQDAPRYRAEACYAVLGQFLPDDLCDDCAPGTFVESWEVVTHYNDMHCTGGKMLVNVLVMAAEHAEKLAVLKRALNAELLADTVTV